MATNKKEAFDTVDVSLADFAKALAHPARVAILKTLAERSTCVCGELVNELPLAQATVSQHLKELKKAGLIKGEIDGAKSCYCINRDVFKEMIGAFDQLFTGLQQSPESSACC